MNLSNYNLLALEIQNKCGKMSALPRNCSPYLQASFIIFSIFKSTKNKQGNKIKFKKKMKCEILVYKIMHKATHVH